VKRMIDFTDHFPHPHQCLKTKQQQKKNKQKTKPQTNQPNKTSPNKPSAIHRNNDNILK
jgi:hypothetical protein